jgi:cobalt-precorrin 5A hydrolase/precorrin-3B C17-methyltransferase
MSIDNRPYQLDESAVGVDGSCPIEDSGKNNTYIFHITANGNNLADRIKSFYPDAISARFDKNEVQECWCKAKSIIFIMASGIVVRTIAPLLSGKHFDPAVVVIDEKGEHVISLCGGHIAGANELASELSKQLNAAPVITTSSDVNQLPAIDLWARDNDLQIENAEMLPKLGVKLANKGRLNIFIDERTQSVGIESVKSIVEEVDFEENDIKENSVKKTCAINLPAEFEIIADPNEADIIITSRNNILLTGSTSSSVEITAKTNDDHKRLILHPKVVVAGIGCNKGTSRAEIENAIIKTMQEAGLSPLSLSAVATIDLKASEPGLVEYCNSRNLEIITFSPDDLNREINDTPGIDKSDIVFSATGAYAVAEPAAILAARRMLQKLEPRSRVDKQEIEERCLQEQEHLSENETVTLVTRKQKIGNTTVALVKVPLMFNVTAGNGKTDDLKEKRDVAPTPYMPTLFVVGTGPGSADHITPYAQRIIAECDVIAGYHTYLRLIPELIENKELVATGMTKELDRCEKAVEQALKGKTVCVVSGGDPGIYAMAGLVFEVIKARGVENSINVEIVPGISALNACAARLGAPLMHDFAAVSLSDRLTPWDLIEKRLEAAASADFVIALYNPRSKGRQGHIEKARDIIMKHREAGTPVGLVKAAMRPDEKIIHTDLARMLEHEIDMQTTVIIGNSSTFAWNEKMVTPRGYSVKRPG